MPAENEPADADRGHPEDVGGDEPELVECVAGAMHEERSGDEREHRAGRYHVALGDDRETGEVGDRVRALRSSTP